MSSPPGPDGNTVSLQAAQGIDRACDRFEAAWRAGERPRLEPYLDGWSDVNVAARSYPEPELSLIERPLRSSDAILSFDDKYLAGAGGLEGASRELPGVGSDGERSCDEG